MSDLNKICDSLKTPDEAKDFIRVLIAEIESLKATVAELQDQLKQSSRNSSKAPSSDSPEQRSKRRGKQPSSRSKGAQPGHKKQERRLLLEDEVDHIHPYFPHSQCDCGGLLSIEDKPRFRHQVFDLPEVRYRVSEHQLFAGTCDVCGKTHTAKWPDWIPSGQMDAGLISTISLLSGEFHLSIRQIQRFLKEQWQLDFSIGAISEAQGKANPWLGIIYRQIGNAVRKAPIAHADETRHFRGTEQRWLWALVTRQLCYFMVHYSRGKVAANQLLGEFNGVLVTDHYAGYNDFPRERRQLCWAHLIRHFIQISERPGSAGKTGRRLLLIAHSVMRTHHRLAMDDKKQETYHARMERLRRSFRENLEKGSQLLTAKRTANQCKHLLKDEALCWTFLNHVDIPLTNNTAEQAIRSYVIWRKLSFASQSHQGDQFRPMILSIVETLKRMGVNTAKVLRQICKEGIEKGEITLQLPLMNALPAPK